MNRTMRKWLGRGTFMALMAGAMLMIGPKYAVADTCSAPEQPGLCPPFTETSCYNWCIEHDYQGGGCVPSEQRGCCTCLI
jgi:hypothetical protein